VAAYSLIELVFVLGVAATLASTGVAQLNATMDAIRAGSAARHVMARLQQARARAIARNRATAVRITLDGRGYALGVFEDGNGNGVTAADIRSGTDAQVGPIERIPEQFPGVDFGALPGLPGADGGVAPGANPVRVGAGSGITFTPLGTATPGSLYVLGSRQLQFVVRVYGETGRTRMLTWNPRTRAWIAR